MVGQREASDSNSALLIGGFGAVRGDKNVFGSNASEEAAGDTSLFGSKASLGAAGADTNEFGSNASQTGAFDAWALSGCISGSKSATQECTLFGAVGGWVLPLLLLGGTNGAKVAQVSNEPTPQFASKEVTPGLKGLPVQELELALLPAVSGGKG